jgi:hypothetical protein
MPRPARDSVDPEFVTAENANELRVALRHVRKQITLAIGTDDLVNILDMLHQQKINKGRVRRCELYESELRLIRFAIDRALESI